MKNPYVAIIDGGGANFASIQSALNRLHIRSKITSDAQQIVGAQCVILPGVGAAGYGMSLLRHKGLSHIIQNLRQPVLGICLGQQLLCTSSEEDNTLCLDIIPCKVMKLQNAPILPHMGWNNLEILHKDDPLLKGVTEKDNFYFVHSFAPEIKSNYVLGACEYGIRFSAIIKKNNFYGVQFHPEKSGDSGNLILKNFLNLSLCEKNYDSYS